VLASSAYLSTSLEPPKWTIAALGCCPAQVRELTFRDLQGPIPPALVREFNCVNSKIYTEDQALVTSCKFSQKLCDIFKDLFFDAFRVLFPDKVQWHCRGKSSSHLDCLYLPPILESLPCVALYIPIVSNHHAFVVRLETTGIATIPPGPPPWGRFFLEA
jgi:hypothetical protein